MKATRTIRLSQGALSADQTLFFYHLGLAMSQWCAVERMMGYVVAYCFAEGDRDKALEGFSAIENLRSKCDYAEAVFGESSHFDIHGDEFKAAIQSVRNSSVRRNKIAHWHVTYYPSSKEVARKTVMLPWTLKEERSGGLEAPKHGLGVRDLESIRLQFFDTFIRLVSLFEKMIGLASQTAKYPALPARQPSIRELRARMLEGLGFPQKPSRAKPSAKEKT